MIVLAQVGRLFRIGREFFEQLSDGTLPAWVPIGLGVFAVVFLGIGIYQIKTRRVVFTGEEQYRGRSATAYGVFLCIAGAALLALGLIAQFAGPSTPVARQADPVRPPSPRVGDGPSNYSRESGAKRGETAEAASPSDELSEESSEVGGGNAELPAEVRPQIPDGLAQIPDDEPAPLLLGEPGIELPPIAYTVEEIRGTARFGDEHGDVTYEDRAPGSGVLVGVRVTFDARRADEIIGVQPIYQVADDYQLGGQLGSADGRVEQVLAKPGYAVGRMDAQTGFSIDGLRLVFFRVEGDRLAADDSYESNWLGREKSEPEHLAGSGDFVVGMFGSADRELRSLGLYFADQFGRRLGTAPSRLPEWKADTPTPVQTTDSGDTETFRDMGPEGSALVGLRVAQGDRFGGAVQAVQPIYQHGEEYRLGKWCGTPGGTEHVLLAKPGYVVARINARAGLVMDAIQLEYVRVDRGRLNLEEVEQSEWIGGRGGSTRDERTQPAILVGVSGAAKESIESLTYYATAPKAGASRRQAARSEETASTSTVVEESRTWTSAKGSHSTEATLLRIVGPQVVLRNAAGKEIKVAIDKLSEADQKYIDQWRAKRRLER